jgi:hypothetical protein
MRLSNAGWSLLGALLIGLLVRSVGVFWGANFPLGWTSHHIDEYTHLGLAGCLLNPVAIEGGAPEGFPDRCPTDYPKGMAAHVALLHMGIRGLQGRLTAPLPSPTSLLITGRVVAVAYGVATIVVVFLLAHTLFQPPPAVPQLAAWILALGGLHVTQSHFFLADVPALFWSLVGLYLLAGALAHRETTGPHRLNLAAVCIGIAFGLKLAVMAVPSLIVVTLLDRPRTTRMLYVAALFLAGVALVNLDSYSPYEFYRTLHGASAVGTAGYHFSRLAGAGIYLLELPSLISYPVTLLALAGVIVLGRQLLREHDGGRRRTVLVIWLLPVVTTLWFVLFKIDNFPRHLLPFVPWMAIAAAWALSGGAESLVRWRVPAPCSIVPVLLYLALFVIDGERVFWTDPRNHAVQWVLDNVPKDARVSWLGGNRRITVPGYHPADYPADPAPDIVVCDMHFANIFLSGMGWRDSYPRDYLTILPVWFSQASVDAWQSLFQGTNAAYAEAARFSEGYVMPEYVVTDRLLGNRSRNYVAEVVIFRRTNSSAAR